MRYTQVASDAFQKIQLNAGLLLNSFTPSSGETSDSAIIGATSGGCSFTAVPTYTDFGEDIDNVPANTKELKKLDSVEVKMSGTFVTADTAAAKLMIGPADIDATDTTKIVPRADVSTDDFTDIWWVGDYSDENGDSNGGFMAIHLINALSSGGFSLQSTDSGKGQFAFEFQGHYSLEDISVVPYEIYIKQGTAAA